MELNPVDYYSLEVSQDYDIEKDEPIMLLTFTPKKDRFSHYHIEIRKENVQELKHWIEEFLK